MPPLLTGQKCGLEETPEPFIFEDSRVPEGKEGDVPKGGGGGDTSGGWEEGRGQQRSTTQGLKSQGGVGRGQAGSALCGGRFRQPEAGKPMTRQKPDVCEPEAGPPLPHTPCSTQYGHPHPMTISSLDVGMGIALWPSSDPQRGKSDGGVGILGKQEKQEEMCVCPSVRPSICPSCSSLVGLEVVTGTVAAIL